MTKMKIREVMERMWFKLETAPVNLRLRKVSIDSKEWFIVDIGFNEMLKPETSRELLELIVKAINAFVPNNANLIISGRMPIWFASALTHAIGHIVKNVAFFDPKLSVAIITAAHDWESKTFTVVKLPEELAKELVQIKI